MKVIYAVLRIFETIQAKDSIFWCSDADDSDTDSESIILETVNSNQMVYAEVLYNFKAVGAEELSLERGALVEVMRIESGPWWWGRIKHDAILSNQNSQPAEGWFPRDFVRVSKIDPFLHR